MSNLMCLAHLLTEPLFRVACAADLKSALAKRGLTLSQAEFKAFSRVWALMVKRMEGDSLLPVDLPDIDVWT